MLCFITIKWLIKIFILHRISGNLSPNKINWHEKSPKKIAINRKKTYFIDIDLLIFTNYCEK